MNSYHSDDKTCCICLDELHFDTSLTCGHKFCFLCIKYITNGLCPLCRKDIDIELNKLTLKDVSYDDKEVFPCVKWMYNSRDKKNWWFYESKSNKIIEDCFSQKKPCQLSFGTTQYNIDFNNMMQIGSNNSQRAIKRIVINNISEWTNLMKDLRGIAGLYFS